VGLLRANRVLIIDDDIADIEGSLLADFETLGVAAELCTSGLAHELIDETRMPDAVIVRLGHAMGGVADSGSVRRFVERMRKSRAARAVPLIGVGRLAADPDMPGDGLFDLSLDEPVNAYQLIGRISAHGRIDAMNRELARRARVAGEFGCTIPEIAAPPARIEDARILYVGDPMSYLAIRSLLPDTADLVGSFTASMAEDYLDYQAFDLVFLNFDPAFSADILESWRRNPRLAALPVVPVLNEAEEDRAADLLRAGASDILIRPVGTDAIATRIDPLVRENRFRHTLLEAYPATHPDAIADADTGLYCRAFLERYLEDALTRSSLQADPMWIVGMRYSALPCRGNEDSGSVGAEFAGTIGGMVRALIRCEDMAAALEPGKLVVALRSRNGLEASVVARRLQAVIGLTPLSGGRDTAPRYADLDIHFVRAAPDMTAEALFKAAFSDETRF